jgi:hypothetical protein
VYCVTDTKIFGLRRPMANIKFVVVKVENECGDDVIGMNSGGNVSSTIISNIIYKKCFAVVTRSRGVE